MKKRRFVYGVLIGIFSIFLLASCGSKAGLTSPEAVEVYESERYFFLENVTAKNKRGQNLTHTVEVTFGEGISEKDGYLIFSGPGEYGIDYRVTIDGKAYTAHTAITVIGND